MLADSAFLFKNRDVRTAELLSKSERRGKPDDSATDDNNTLRGQAVALLAGAESEDSGVITAYVFTMSLAGAKRISLRGYCHQLVMEPSGRK